VDIRSIGGLNDDVNRKPLPASLQTAQRFLGISPDRVYLNSLTWRPPTGAGTGAPLADADGPVRSQGTYVLIASVAQMKHLEIGRLGTFDVVGSGLLRLRWQRFGAGGLRARIGHHLESTAAPHWHIDYLLGIAEPIEVLVQHGESKT